MQTGGRHQQRSGPALQLLQDDSPEPMLVIDGDSLKFLEVNRAASTSYGYTRSELLGLQLQSVIASEDRRRAMAAIRQTPIDPSALQGIHWILKGGKTTEVDLLVQPVQYNRKRALLVTPQDCARRRQLEDQLRQAHKMEAVGMLAGGIAHDFNNLLTIINGYSQMVLSSLQEEDENRGSVEQIMKAGERAAELTRQLLTFSRRQVVRPKILDLNAIVAGAAVMLRRLIGEHIELRIVAGPDLSKIHADPGQLEQVIMNLAVNSRDAMPHGGTLILETQNVDLSESFRGPNVTLQPGRYVMLTVTDTGTGMDAQTVSHLFEPFFTTKAQGEGTGLGLSTVHGIVRQSGGEIVVHSKTGQGTCVNIYFPGLAEAAPEDPADVDAEQAYSGTETILLVEDEEAVRKLVRQTLERRGYRVLVAASGQDAIRLTEREPGRIHLLISDVVMPQMGGRQLADQLKVLRPKIKVLYVSGYTESALVHTGTLKPGEVFLQKPFTPAMLGRSVRELLDRANGAPPALTESCGN